MTRRIGRSGAGVWWLGVVVTLLGGASACGDDDGDDSPNGTGGASTGGNKSGSGGAKSGSGGIQAGGGSSGAAPKGGSGGSSGGAKSGSGGIAPTAGAGEGGAPGEGGGGAGPSAGNPGGGSGGDAGSGSIAGAPSAGENGAGQPGTGGASSGGTSGVGGGNAGSGGGADVPVEYRSCEKGASVTRVEVFRIDRESGTCTVIEVQQAQINCLEGLKSGDWCVIAAALSDDVEACEEFRIPSNPIEATAGEGTFTVSTQPLAIDIDVEFDFPVSGDLPRSVSVEADNCLADCVANDCRP